MNIWYNTDNREKKIAYEQIALKVNLPEYAIEKDWWVVQTLAILFEMEIGKQMVFKGGTSLSKAWNLIERFSEDIDLAIDRKFYGFAGELGKKQRTNLRKAANIYIVEELYPELKDRFIAKGFKGVRLELEEITTSDQDPIIIRVYYPNVIESPGYLKPNIQIEIGCRSLREPFTMKEVTSFLDQHYPGAETSYTPTLIPTVDPERTMLEKIFLLHEEFQRPHEKARVERMSRHLYDIFKLSQSPFAHKALDNKELYAEIVRHRFMFTKLGGVDYALHNPKTINPIPPQNVFSAWKNDYKIMQEQMIYGNSPDFETMLDTIKAYVAKMNQLDWKIFS